MKKIFMIGELATANTNDIRSLLALSDSPQSDCSSANEIASSHLREIELRIAQLKRLKRELKNMTEICAGGKTSECRVLGGFK